MANELLARAPTPVNIFISYRRDDAAGQAGRLRTNLGERFGAEHVFMDVADLRPGENFVKVIQDRVARCDVLIALIGSRWSLILDERTKRRALESTQDYVRIELESALQRDARIRVVPVLIDSTQMPGPDALPRPLRRISELAAAELRHSRWDDDVASLIGRIDEIRDEIGTSPAPEPVVSRPPPPPPAPPHPVNPLAPPPDRTHQFGVIGNGVCLTQHVSSSNLSSIEALAFLPNGNLLSAGEDNGIVEWDSILWDSKKSLDTDVCRLAGRDLTADEWNLAFAGTTLENKVRKTC